MLDKMDEQWMRQRKRKKPKPKTNTYSEVRICSFNGLNVSVRTSGFIQSPMEKRLEAILKNIGIFYLKEVRFGKMHFYYDFYIPSINTVIEYDGVDYHSNPSDVIKDAKKSQWLRSNGIRILSIDKTSIQDVHMLVQNL